jgi:hypothetical protein
MEVVVVLVEVVVEVVEVESRSVNKGRWLAWQP